MDAQNRKIVAFSFFDQTPDFFDIKKPLKVKHTDDLFDDAKSKEADKLWRPSTAFALSMQDHPKGGTIDEYHLFYQPGHKNYGKKQARGAEWIKAAIERLSQDTRVTLEKIDIGDGHDFENVYLKLKAFFQEHQALFKDRTNTRYFVNVTAGTHVSQMCLFLLIQERLIPAEVVQVYRDVRDEEKGYRGKCNITNIVLTSEEYAHSRIHEEQEQEAGDNEAFLKKHIKTNSPAYNKMIREVARGAVRTNDPILILGPTGAGKSRLAQLIYDLKKERGLLIYPQGKFVSINCAALTQNLVESELFGHVKGAFTGAIRDQQGCLKQADGGILFLDEIGCLPAHTQGKLLKALDSGKFLPLGGEKDVKSDFQLICGTNEDLQALAHSKGKLFRLDLLERIRTWTYVLPGLAERREDIDPNIDVLLEEHYKKTKNKRVFANDAARQCFLEYTHTIPFEGNFRELKRMVTRMATLSDDTITIDLVREEIERHKNETAYSAPTAEAISPDESQFSIAKEVLVCLLGNDYASRIDLIDLVQLQCVIEACCRNDVRSLADAGRVLYAHTEKHNTSKRFNASGYMKTFFDREAFKPFGITFPRIKETLAIVRAKRQDQATTI